MHRFYVDAGVLDDSPVSLDGAAARQIRRVLRLRPGERIALFCGDGAEHQARIEAFTTTGVQLCVDLTCHPETELPGELEVGLAILKGEKLEWTVQKLTELGVHRIVLLQTERVVPSVPADRWPARLERLRTIAREAAEQSGRVRLPRIDGPIALSAYLGDCHRVAAVLLTRCSDLHLGRRLPPGSSAARLIVGPEGGFTQAEQNQALLAGAALATLGSRTLRSETAAIVAAAVAAAIIGEATAATH